MTHAIAPVRKRDYLKAGLLIAVSVAALAGAAAPMFGSSHGPPPLQAHRG